MDKTTAPGLVGAFLCVVVAVILDGGSPLHLFGLPAFILVVGATWCVGLVISPLSVLSQVPRIFLKALLDRPTDLPALVNTFVGLADRARREGLLALEQEAAQLDPFTRKGILLVVDGSDAEMVREILEAEIEGLERRHKVGQTLFESMGAYAPTIGIVGTTTGLIHVLGNLASPEELGHAIASAFIATLYGVASANLFYLPVAQKLKAKSAHEVWVRELCIAGVLAVQAGDNPRTVREKLEAQLPLRLRAGDEQRDAGPEMAGRAAA